MRRARVDVLRGPDLLDLALVDDGDDVGDAERLLLVVGDEDRGQLLLGEDLAHLFAHPRPQAGVEVGEGLVEEQRPRLGDQRPRQRHPLLLAAGELVRVALAEAAEADRLQRRGDLVAVGPAAERVADVGGDVHVGEERVVLEDHADPAALGRERSARAPRPPRRRSRRAGVGLLEAGDQPQRRRLAAAAGAEQGADRALGDVEVETVDGDDVTEGFAQAAQAQPGGSGWTLRTP